MKVLSKSTIFVGFFVLIAGQAFGMKKMSELDKELGEVFEKQDREVVEYLQEFKNMTDKQKADAKSLHSAAAEGDIEEVKLLVGERGVDPSIPKRKVSAREPFVILKIDLAISVALRNGHLDVAEYLLKVTGINLNLCCYECLGGAVLKKTTPLHGIIAVGSTKTLELCLKVRGLDVNPEGPAGFTPLNIVFLTAFGDIDPDGEKTKLLLKTGKVDMKKFARKFTMPEELAHKLVKKKIGEKCDISEKEQKKINECLKRAEELLEAYCTRMYAAFC